MTDLYTVELRWQYDEFDGPAVTSISPTSGVKFGGTSVTITGTGFLEGNPGVNTVTFGGQGAASVVTVSDTSITCDTPAGHSGTTVFCLVSNAFGIDTLVNAWTYFARPTITSVTPASGALAGGTILTDIAGTGFLDNSPGTNTVTIGGASVTSLVVISDVKMTGVSPSGTLGVQDVVVSNDNESGTLTDGFFYIAGDEKEIGTPTGTEKTIGAATGTEKTIATVAGAEKTIATVAGIEKTITAGAGTEKTIAVVAGTEKTIAAVAGTEKTIAVVAGTEKTIVTSAGTEKTIATVAGTEKIIVTSAGTEKTIT